MTAFKRSIKRGMLAVAALATIVFAANSSTLRGERGVPKLLAHRGVAQQFSREGLTRQSCTAAVMLPSTHQLLENTIPSIDAAFDYGADMVEIDVHPTTDGDFVVFHDWTLDCRTDGIGVTREHSLKELKALDIGFGYTADGGKTYPFRGKFKGAMPSLAEVLSTFPRRRFLINIKGSEEREGALLADYVMRHAADPTRLGYYGSDVPIAALRTALPNARTVTRSTMKACVLAYLAKGGAGIVPDQCRRTIVFVPINYRSLLWGWPNLFVDRMRSVDTEVYVIGPLTSETDNSGVTSIDDPADVSSFIDGYSGGISTDRIDVMGPYIRGLPSYVPKTGR